MTILFGWPLGIGFSSIEFKSQGPDRSMYSGEERRASGDDQVLGRLDEEDVPESWILVEYLGPMDLYLLLSETYHR